MIGSKSYWIWLNFVIGRQLSYEAVKNIGANQTSPLLSVQIIYAILFAVSLLKEDLSVGRRPVTDDVITSIDSNDDTGTILYGKPYYGKSVILKRIMFVHPFSESLIKKGFTVSPPTAIQQMQVQSQPFAAVADLRKLFVRTRIHIQKILLSLYFIYKPYRK